MWEGASSSVLFPEIKDLINYRCRAVLGIFLGNGLAYCKFSSLAPPALVIFLWTIWYGMYAKSKCSCAFSIGST